MTSGRDDRLPPVRSAGVAATTRSDDVLPTQQLPATCPAIVMGTWGGMRLIEELGRGSFGRVYRAWEDTLAREVALKVISLPEPDPDLAKLYLREGRMLARVRHQNVVAVYGALHQGNEIGLWMELIRGRRLADIVREDGPFGADEATVVGISLCHALSAVHGAGLLHRDLKAHNVMREEGGRIVLMDFGAGRDAATAPRTGDYSGTPLYMAPEVLAGREASGASDVYSLGVLLYFLVTGAYPIEGPTTADIVAAHGFGRRVRLVDRRADLPDQFTRVVERAIEPSLQRRYASAGAMLEDLATAVAALSPERQAQLLPRSEQQSVAGEFAKSGKRAHRSPIVVWTTVLLSAVAMVAFLGLLTSNAFDLTLGRTAEFERGPLLNRLGYGVSALVPPLVYAAVFVIAIRLATAALRSFGRLVPPAGRVLRRLRSELSVRGKRYGLDNNQMIAQWVVVLQALALGMTVWAFSDLLWALMSFIDNSEPEKLHILRWRNLLHLQYRIVLSVLIATMAIVWWKLLSSHRGDPPERSTTASGIAIIGIAALLLVVPYRVLIHNQFERADYGDQRCYVIGQRVRDAADLLVFCPDGAPPRNRVVRDNDPLLRRSGVTESIFMPREAAAR